MSSIEMKHSPWPELNFQEIQDTFETLHQWLQIVGKIRLNTMPWINQSWHSTLYITPTGYSTNSIPYNGRNFQIDFNFRTHQLIIQCSDSAELVMDLTTKTVADFYEELFEKLRSMGIEVEIYGKPNELASAIPFKDNTVNKTYDPNAAFTLWQVMLRAEGVFSKFRSAFIGKSSPVHLFWGGFDLALTRFSGKKAPLWQGTLPPNMPLSVMQEAYSQEVSSAGFWPGSRDFPNPLFYAYAYPTPETFASQQVKPKEAFYSEDMGEFILNYADVQKSADPEKMLIDFLTSTYEATANTGNWDKDLLR